MPASAAVELQETLTRNWCRTIQYNLNGYVPMNTSSLPPVAPIGNLETLQALSDSQRHRIVSLLMERNLTAKELSKALGIGRTRLYYHLEILERHGLIRVTDAQLVSGILERRYRAVARSFRVDRALLSSAAPAAKIVRAQGAIVESVAADYYASAPRHASAGDALIWRGFLRLNTKRRRELRKRLLTLVAQFRDPDPSGIETEAAIVLFPTQGTKR